jgi:hypothetical protein
VPVVLGDRDDEAQVGGDERGAGLVGVDHHRLEGPPLGGRGRPSGSERRGGDPTGDHATAEADLVGCAEQAVGAHLAQVAPDPVLATCVDGSPAARHLHLSVVSPRPQRGWSET